MHTRHRRSPARLLCKVGLSCLLVAGAETPLAVLAEAAGSQPLEPPREELAPLARAEAGPGQCQGDGTPFVEPAPELLALADWPLDDSPVGRGCGTPPSTVAGVEPLPSPIEIPEVLPVVPVVAWEAGSAAAPPNTDAPAAVPPARLEQRVAAVVADSIRGLRRHFRIPDIRLKSSLALDSIGAGETLPPATPIYGYPEVVKVTAANMADETAAPAPAAAADLPPNPLGVQLAAIDTDSLDNIRGGFEMPDLNLRLSFGIERAVYINGELVTSTVINVKDLQGLSGGSDLPATLPGNAGAALTLIQNGSGNGFTTHIGPNLAGTVIQNTLDNQKITNVTIVNATVNSAQIVRSMNLQSAIRDGVIQSMQR